MAFSRLEIFAVSQPLIGVAYYERGFLTGIRGGSTGRCPRIGSFHLADYRVAKRSPASIVCLIGLRMGLRGYVSRRSPGASWTRCFMGAGT